MPPGRQSVGPRQEAAASLSVYLLVLWSRRWLFVSILVLTFASAWAFLLIVDAHLPGDCHCPH